MIYIYAGVKVTERTKLEVDFYTGLRSRGHRAGEVSCLMVRNRHISGGAGRRGTDTAMLLSDATPPPIGPGEDEREERETIEFHERLERNPVRTALKRWVPCRPGTRTA